MRIAIFSKIPPLPATGGNRARILQLCLRLVARGHEVRFYLIPSSQVRNLDEPGCEALFGKNGFKILRLPRWGLWPIYSKVVAMRALERVLARSIKSTSADYLCAASLIATSKREMRSFDPDIVIVEYVHFSKILDAAPEGALRVLDTHDSFHNEFTDKAEAAGLQRADVIIALQDKEKARFETLVSARNTVISLSHLLPLPTDRLQYTGVIGATFVGSAFPANLVSLNGFIRNVLPILCRQRPEFRLYVAGSICNRIEDGPNIVKLGVVESLEQAYAACPILVNSITDGTGVKIKLLEAMNLGVPVVSTTRGVEGIGPDLLEGVAVAPDNDFEMLAAQLLQLATSPEQWAQASSAVRRSASKWNTIQEDNLDRLLQMAAEKQASFRSTSQRAA